jgi:hypothetical protein
MQTFKYDTRECTLIPYREYNISNGKWRFWSREIDLGPTQYPYIRRALILTGDL